MTYQKAHVVGLKSHQAYNEKWLQQRIAEDPALLGLGDLILKDEERLQPGAGRLDLLLFDPEDETRYEVEIQLGSTDPSHIIRTIEYWDIERTRYPHYDHVAVIVAEDITSRFLNVISLFNKAIPLIAIQIRALQVGEALTLHATTVLDLRRLGTEEEDEPGVDTDRAYWLTRGSITSVGLADDVLDLVNEVTPGHQLKYNKHYIGLNRDGLVDNFVTFRPRKEHVVIAFRIPRSEELTARLAESEIDLLPYNAREGRYRMRPSKHDLVQHRELLSELVSMASGMPLPAPSVD